MQGTNREPGNKHPTRGEWKHPEHVRNPDQTVPIHINGVLVRACCFVVSDLREDILLGYPWFVEEEIVLDARRQCICFGRNDRATAYYAPASRKPPRPIAGFRHLHMGFPDAYEPELISLATIPVGYVPTPGVKRRPDRGSSRKCCSRALSSLANPPTVPRWCSGRSRLAD